MTDTNDSITCPKCKPIRGCSETSPLWQCPNCGIAYCKFKEESQFIPFHESREVDAPTARETLANIALGFIILGAFLVSWLLIEAEIKCIWSFGPMVMALACGARIFMQARYKFFSRAYHMYGSVKAYGPDGKPTFGLIVEMILCTFMGLLFLFHGLSGFARSCL